jgi:hypothetical protein
VPVAKEIKPPEPPKPQPKVEPAPVPVAKEVKPPEPPKPESKAEPGTVPAAPVPQPVSVAKEVKEPEPPRTDAAAQSSQNVNEPPKEVSPVPSRGPDQQTVLALTPMPAPRDEAIRVPVGEARGRFAISPEPNLTTSETQPGSKVDVRPSPTVGIGNTPSAPVGSGASPNPATVVNITFGPKLDAAAGGGTGGDTARGPGPGTAPGAGSVAGSGAANSPGSGSGAGTGSGASPAKSPFSGITIVGGVGATGAATNSTPSAVSVPRPERPLQTSYGLTVVSTESSGGGLPSFGVFSHDQIYTVYLDMRRTEGESVPSWTLEFAVSQPDPVNGSAADPQRAQQGLVLPFPAVKEHPLLLDEAVRRHNGKTVIVYGVVNVEGRLEQLTVKDSPDPLLNDPILNTLSKWVFRAARLNGEAVPAKVLIGIPLSLPQ